MKLSNRQRQIMTLLNVVAATMQDASGHAHILVKIPEEEAERLRGPIPVRHFLESEEIQRVAVIAWCLAFGDDPSDSLLVCTYLDVSNDWDLAALRHLQERQNLRLHLLDEQTWAERCSKEITPPADAGKVLGEALAAYQRHAWDSWAYNAAMQVFRQRHPRGSPAIEAFGAAAFGPPYRENKEY